MAKEGNMNSAHKRNHQITITQKILKDLLIPTNFNKHLVISIHLQRYVLMQTAYLKIYKKGLLLTFIILFILGTAYKIYCIGQFYVDPITKRKQWVYISRKIEAERITPFVVDMLTKYSQFQLITYYKSGISNIEQQKKIRPQLKDKITELSILLEQKQGYQMLYIINHKQPLLIYLPNNILFLSVGLFKLQQINITQLATLCTLFKTFSDRRLHVKDISLFDAFQFTGTSIKQTSRNELLLRQVYMKKFDKELENFLSKTKQVMEKNQKNSQAQNKKKIYFSEFTNVPEILKKLTEKGNVCSSEQYHASAQKANLCRRLSLWDV